jgi:hypothetical protein
MSLIRFLIEVAFVRGIPGNRPAHPLPVGLELLERRAGDEDQRRVACVQMAQVTDVVNDERTRGAAFLPARVEHEVVDEKLVAAVEQVGEPGFLGPLDDVALGDLDHR